MEPTSYNDLLDRIALPLIELPGQIERYKRDRFPEGRLLLAVLSDAFKSLTRQPPWYNGNGSEWGAQAKSKAQRETVEWFENPESGLITLAMCCACLGLEVEAVQSAARRKIL